MTDDDRSLADRRGQSYPEAHAPEREEHEEHLPGRGVWDDDPSWSINPETGRPLDAGPPPEARPEPEPANPWDSVPDESVLALGAGLDEHNDLRAQLGYERVDESYFDQTLREGGQEALQSAYNRMSAATEHLQFRIDRGERRPLSAEDQALAEATGVRGGEFDPAKNDQYRLDKAVERGDEASFWAELERQGGVMPKEHQGGPDSEPGFYSNQ